MASPDVRGRGLERDPVSVLFDRGARRLLDRAYARPGEWAGTRIADPPRELIAHFAALGINVTGPDNPSSPRATVNAHTRWCRGFIRALYYQHKWYSPHGRGPWRAEKRISPRAGGTLDIEFGRRVPAVGVIPAGRAVRIRIRRRRKRLTDDQPVRGLVSDPSRRDW